MRAYLATATLVIAAISCGGGGADSTAPNDPFPSAAGVYNVSGSFDDLPSATAHFEGTLTLTQANRQSGALTGSAAYLATLGTDIFNLNDASLDGAAVSTTGVITYTMSNGAGTWTFSGTLSGNNIINGRHTLGDGTQSFSGAWTATRSTSSSMHVATTGSLSELGAFVARLRTPR